ncbi:MAG: D-hexose-6-phosphate mutarotase [Comamonas sp.]
MSDSAAQAVATAAATATATTWQGLPAIALQLPGGDSALIALQGAQVLSWRAGGQQRLFLSPGAAHDGHTPIRGGIPVCFPQFNQRGPLVKHGFARSMAWSADAQNAKVLADGALELVLTLQDSETTRAVWPHAFEAQLCVQLRPAALTVQLKVHNLGQQELPFTAALHSYLQMPLTVEQMQLQGLDGLQFWDAVADTHPVQQGPLGFGVETDRVYPCPPQTLQLRSTAGAPWLEIGQDADWSETVVWNPGPDLCAQLADMEPEGYRQMLCVEAAAIDAPVVLAPGQRWQAAQYLRADPAR